MNADLMQHHRASGLRFEVVGNEKCPVIYLIVESENPRRILRKRNSRESLFFLLLNRSNGQRFVFRLGQIKAVVVDEINETFFSERFNLGLSDLGLGCLQAFLIGLGKKSHAFIRFFGFNDLENSLESVRYFLNVFSV